MVEVISSVGGNTIAFFEDVGLSVKVLKQSLAVEVGIPRFRLRLLANNWALEDNQTLTCLVILGFEPHKQVSKPFF